VAKNLARNQLDAQRRQGKHQTEYIIIFKIIKYSEALDNLPSVTLFEPAFQLNALVESIPDTTRGIDPEHSVALYGNIAAMKDEDGWWYRIKCMHTGRNGSWIPECRIKA
jgi:hypothetical protein